MEIPRAENEIWEAVKALQGRTLFTYVDEEPNLIDRVDDTNNGNDVVQIRNRDTKPTRRDIIAAYQLLHAQGNLRRIPDLEWLATPEKKTSSIVFRIVGEISRQEADYDPESDTIRVKYIK